MISPGLPSLWLSRRAAPETDEEVDLAIVGGGIVGLSTAYWLGKAGKRAVLLEAGGLAGRASGRNAGFLLTGSAEPYTALAASAGERAARRFWEVSSENRELLRTEVLDPGRVDCEFLPEGSWVAALSDTGQEEVLQESARQLAALGFNLEWREAAEVRRVSGSAALGGALYQPRDGGLDPVRLCRGIGRLARGMGVEIRTGFSVRAIEPAGARVRLVSDSGSLVARQAVLAVNAYAASLVPALATEVRPVRGQMLATDPGPRDLPGVWYINDGYEYVRQVSDGTVALGGCRWAAREFEVGTQETPTGTVQGALERFLAEFFPRFAERPIRHRWAGIMAFTADGLPRIGALPEIPAALYAVGFNGHGMSLGFATGRYLARRLSGEDLPPLFP
ncbi:MAG TPA: FAD-binding oxidoreductase [Thermoanaerobaculia bacterium]|nr:FAD-binding oxidoreductase [Thermoanaerobaculia bacterium]